MVPAVSPARRARAPGMVTSAPALGRRAATREAKMRQLFRRQLAAYAQYHRDPHNCVTHFVGIPMLFLAVILPLEAVRIHLGHHTMPLAILLTLPAIVGWLLLDLGVGAALLLLLCPLFIAAALIDRHGEAAMWGTTAVLFFVG